MCDSQKVIYTYVEFCKATLTAYACAAGVAVDATLFLCMATNPLVEVISGSRCANGIFDAIAQHAA